MLNEKQLLELLNTVFKSDDNNSEIRHLKTTYFNLESRYQNLSKIKERIDKSVNFNTNIRLLVLLAILVAQTAIFANWIWNTEYLGWDLVEPMTFLFQSCVFITGLFFYVKLNRNAISGEKLKNSVSNRVRLRKYIKYNFNHKEYEKLEEDKNKIKKLIDLYYLKH